MTIEFEVITEAYVVTSREIEMVSIWALFDGEACGKGWLKSDTR